MQTKHITVLPYDPQWPADFQAICQELTPALGDLVLVIEHVGSTAVPGLASKPIIDIDIVIRDAAALPDIIARLARIGYLHEGNLGVPDREAFCYEGKLHLREHHIYVCPQNTAELHRHLTFRDYLRNHPEAAAQYGRIKQEAAALHPKDIDSYIAHKSGCIEALYAACGLV